MQYAPKDGNAASPRSLNRSPRPKDRRLPYEGSLSKKSNKPTLLTGDSRRSSGHDDQDQESDYDHSTLSGTTLAEESTTSSMDGTRPPGVGSLAEQLSKHFASKRGQMPQGQPAS